MSPSRTMAVRRAYAKSYNHYNAVMLLAQGVANTMSHARSSRLDKRGNLNRIRRYLLA
jgi:hypothetical protein